MTDPFAPPPPEDDATTHRAKPKLCGETEPTDCERGHRCNLYIHHEVDHRADFCGHRWRTE